MSNIPTRLSGLTTEELLRRIDDIRSKSPIIEELCQRIERGETVPMPQEAIEAKDMECPVCMAKLTVSFDPNENTFSIEG